MSEEVKDSAPEKSKEEKVQLEGGTYEILRKRLLNHADILRGKISQLNQARKEVFGAIETSLIANERVSTENNCVPWDMIPIDNSFLFGYNVQFGLKTETTINDVFSYYKYENHTFQKQELTLLDDQRFKEDFYNLYRYYKKTQFVKFARIGVNYYMVFRTGQNVKDIKVFKWILNHENTLVYHDARSEHEFVYPSQHEFEWKRTNRDQHREGEHPHISIEDKVFVETINGDLTIKVEDNTNTGHGIYAEEVDYKEQKLDDGEISYAIVGNLILLRIRPYQENEYRYIIYNIKIQKAVRVDSIADACILLPDDHGLIFPHGYYLQSGEYKVFDNNLENLVFEKRITSPNGEDYLFVFYHQEEGIYLLLPYNLIEQEVGTPIICYGYSLFDNGELCYFKGDDEPKKHHAIQIWQTPFTDADFQIPNTSDSILFKIGNKDIVRAMSECNEMINLISKDESYDGLYFDILKKATDITDAYYWLEEEATYQLKEPLKEIKSTSTSAIDEFEKVVRIRKNTKEQVLKVTQALEKLFKTITTIEAKNIDEFVEYLGALRSLRGELISTKELRYVNLLEIEALEKELVNHQDQLSERCVAFLMRDDALDFYVNKVKEIGEGVPELTKVIEAEATEELIKQTSSELEMLIDIVSNLKIKDATQTTSIIDNISSIYSSFNQITAALKNKRKELLSVEGKAEFNAQMKLINQGIINYVDMCDSPQKCDEYMTKLMVQLEELEGKFSEFDDFVEKISLKREEVYNAFENKKVQLVELKNKRTNSLFQSAERIIKAVHNRLSRMEDVNDINGYFAGDLMIEKARNIIDELVTLGDSVKADDIQSRLKSTREEAIRQLKDRTELFTDGNNLITFGNFKFLVNEQTLGLSLIQRNDKMYYHLTGTGFFEEVTDPVVVNNKDLWEQSIVSENKQVYRSEYLAWSFFESLVENSQVIEYEKKTIGELTEVIHTYMATRYDEGYVKGVHDTDAAKVLDTLIRVNQLSGLLRFSSTARACAQLYWECFADQEKKALHHSQMRGAGLILQVFPGTKEFEGIRQDLENEFSAFIAEFELFDSAIVEEASEYLFWELAQDDAFTIDGRAKDLVDTFKKYLKEQKSETRYDKSIKSLQDNTAAKYKLIRTWLGAFVEFQKVSTRVVDEACVLLLLNNFQNSKVTRVQMSQPVEGLLGSHELIKESKLVFDLNQFRKKLTHYKADAVPRFKEFQVRKKEVVEEFVADLRLNEFKPRVMSSFVRNQLIDKVYLPLIGANLAKQIGAAGEGKRTDLMGMLLLISPPGYGKTTLMEYIANRLGIIFMKINGPAIGHEVTSVDPAQAPNASAGEELNKLNLAFEMGDNVMIYLDDIQHCNPEFLQKFISLCDGQRKIEGVYKGKPKTYDFRGKKVAVVMAGNPYTESGDKFQIPDMLANRADIYNLGDVIGDSADVFELSYIENCLTSNSVLNKLALKNHKDLYPLLKIAETGESVGVEFEASYGPEEINEYVSVLKKLIVIRDAVLSVNQQYIYSAAQAEDYRVEPPFKLQGSYRNMNKLAEKVMPIMNEQELETLILSHYENESQTLTTGAEANMLKFKELFGVITEEEKARWEEIKTTFAKNNKMKSMGSDQQFAHLIDQISTISGGLGGIKNALSQPKEKETIPVEQKKEPTAFPTETFIELIQQLKTNQEFIQKEIVDIDKRDQALAEEALKEEQQKEEVKKHQREVTEKVKQEHEDKLERLCSLIDVVIINKGFQEGEKNSYITYDFVFTNKTDKEFKGFRGTIEFFDQFNERVYYLDLVFEEGLMPEESIQWQAQTVFNQFMESDVLMNEYSLEDLHIEWKPDKVIYKNGKLVS